MRGRYERPKQKRFGKKAQAQNYYPAEDMGEYSSDFLDNYPGDDTGYGADQYPEDKGGFWWGLLGFFLPIVGLILFLVWRGSRPRRSGAVGKGALVGVIAFLVIAIAIGTTLALGANSFLNKLNKVDVNVSYTEDPNEVSEPDFILETTEAATETTAAETTEPPHVPSRDDYINFLVVGQSGRGEGDAEQARFADTMMVCTLNTYEKTLTITSLLRDAFVKMPDYKGHTGGRIKLATIYHMGYVYSGNTIAGSMELMDLCLFRNFGIEIDYNFEVDFDAFVNIVHMLGGIDIEITEAEANYLNKDDLWVREDVEPGMVHLGGMATLSYARMRKAEGDGDSDIKRTARQQKVIQALMGKVRNLSLGELQDMADEILPMISTSMSNSEITSMMVTLLPMLKDLKIVSGGTCPANYQGDMVDIYSDGMKHSVLRFNEAETKAHMRELTLGEIPGSK